MATAAVQSDPPLIVRGKLAIRTIPGRNGRFTVGRLTTRLGLFHVKDPNWSSTPKGSTRVSSSSATSIRRPIRLAMACALKSAPT